MHPHQFYRKHSRIECSLKLATTASPTTDLRWWWFAVDGEDCAATVVLDYQEEQQKDVSKNQLKKTRALKFSLINVFQFSLTSRFSTRFAVARPASSMCEKSLMTRGTNDTRESAPTPF